MSHSHGFISKSDQKINHLLPNNYRSLTNVKTKEDAPLINAELLTVCRNKKECAVSLSPEVLRESLLDFLAQTNNPATTKLSNHLREWMGSRWKDLRMHIANRINKLQYLYPSLLSENFGVIEKEILIEWKKNSFLQGFQLLSNYTFTSENFQKLQELQEFYNKIRTVISQISFLLFQPSLDHLTKQQFPLQDKLFNYTAVSIITSSKEWPNIAEKIIKPHFLRKCPSFSENYNLDDLNASPQLIDPYTNEKLYEKTASSITKLSTSYSPITIIGHLKQYRSNLVSQMQTNINSWRKKHNKAKQIVLEKEDVLACIIYSLVTHKLDHIGITLKYLSFLYENHMESVLGSYQVDVYRVDLEVAHEYLTQPVVRLSIEDFGKIEEVQETNF